MTNPVPTSTSTARAQRNIWLPWRPAVDKSGGRWVRAFFCVGHECRCRDTRPDLCRCRAFGGYVGLGVRDVVYNCEECSQKYGELPLPRLPDPPAGRNVFGGADFGGGG